MLTYQQSKPDRPDCYVLYIQQAWHAGLSLLQASYARNDI